jgi:hypothetical protein
VGLSAPVIVHKKHRRSVRTKAMIRKVDMWAEKQKTLTNSTLGYDLKI